MDIDLQGEWSGWRIRGRYLISPDRERISVQRLQGIVLTEFLRQKFGPKPGRRDAGAVLISDFRERLKLAKASERD